MIEPDSRVTMEPPCWVMHGGLQVRSSVVLYRTQCVRRAAESSTEARPEPGAQAGQEEDDGRQNYYIGECGHRVPAESDVGGLLFRTVPRHPTL